MEALLCLLHDTEKKIWEENEAVLKFHIFHPPQVYNFTSLYSMVDKIE